jgi:pimeloyl-ACP methyl ester carboxylesterase
MGQYVETATGLLHEVEFGGEGQVIMLVHGLGGSTTNWMAVADGLARHGRVVAIDLPGFGLSPPARDYRLETHQMAVESYLERHEGPVTMIGNSTGGLLSEMVASHRPELVRRLILVAPATPPIFPDPRFDWPTATRLAIQATPMVGEAWGRRFIRNHTPQQLVRMSMQMITHKPGRVPLPLVEASVEMARVRKALPWSAEATARTASSIAAYYANRARFVRMVRAITARTLVVQGISDHIVSPSAVEWLCRLRPDWDLAQMADTGHTPQMDAPLRFLSEVEPWLTKTEEAGISPAGVGKPVPN